MSLKTKDRCGKLGAKDVQEPVGPKFNEGEYRCELNNQNDCNVSLRG
jgi:hypothetical protein